MEILSRNGAQYRTQLLTLEHAERFAACLRANDLFDGVLVFESDRAKGERRWFVVYHPSSSEAREVLLQRQEDKRRTRAAAEASEYLFIHDSDRRFFWCQSASGALYEVTLFGCTCPDHEHRCRGAGIRCKHQLALADLHERGGRAAA